MKRTALLSLVMILMLMLLTGCKSSLLGNNNDNDTPAGTGTVGSARFSEGLEYELAPDEKSYHLIGMGTCTEKEIHIPDTYKDLPVTSIATDAFSKTSITSIKLGKFTERIAYRAFKNCKSLKEVKLNTGISIIDSNAFEGCESLLDISFPESLHLINTYAFKGCTMLESATYADGIKVTEISKGLFSGCSSLKNILFEGSTAIILVNEFAFEGCTSLEETILPDTVTEVKESAYNGCTSLKVLYIPRDLTTINSSLISYPFDSVRVSPDNEKYSSEGNCLLLKESNVLLR